MSWNRRLRSGYSDLGAITIPPVPQTIVLTDRADGSLWAISYNESFERLSLNSDFATLRNLEGVRLYGPFEGPPMDEDGEFTLMVRNGHIGLDYNVFPVWEEGLDAAPPYARKTTGFRKLKISTTNPATTHIGYTT